MFNAEELTSLKALIHEYYQLKRAILFVESLDPKTKVNIQLLKEQRDALDHVMSLFRNKIDPNPADKDNYFKINIEKALGHFYRAGFDTYDCEVLIAKDELENFLQNFPPDVCHTVIPEYTQKKSALRKLVTKMADLRGQKDAGIDLSPIFNEYIEKLRTFKDISDEIYGCEEELNNYKNSVKRFWKKDFWKGFALVVLGVMITLLFEIVKDSIKGENPHNLQTPQTTQTPAKS